MKRRFSSVGGNTFVPSHPNPKKDDKPTKTKLATEDETQQSGRNEEKKLLKRKDNIKERVSRRHKMAAGDALKLLQIAVERKAKSLKRPT